MKKLLLFLKRCRFLIVLLAAFIISDTLLGVFFDGYAMKSGNFWLNDYEITRRSHPEEKWDKVFFGNSAVISGYREDLSKSGYINFGVDYGSIKDILKILRSGEVKIGSNLVIGINWATLFDNMETNPTYFWNQKTLETYSYFQRDRLNQAFTGKLKSIITGKSWSTGQFKSQTKEYYYSCLPTAQIIGKLGTYQERYWSTGVEGCKKNLDALKETADYCQKHGIRLRVVLMPWNPTVNKPDVVKTLEKNVSDICKDKKIDMLDLTNSFDAECFYDLGHMNYEYGAHKFTEAIDKWLSS